jgi:hypothetical protein
MNPPVLCFARVSKMDEFFCCALPGIFLLAQHGNKPLNTCERAVNFVNNFILKNFLFLQPGKSIFLFFTKPFGRLDN